MRCLLSLSIGEYASIAIVTSGIFGAVSVFITVAIGVRRFDNNKK